MNNAMMNQAAGLLELTAQEMIGVAGGVGAEPTWPKVSSSAGEMQIGEDPPLPKVILIDSLVTIGEEPKWPK